MNAHRLATVQFDRRLMAYVSWWSPIDNVGEVYMLRGAIISSFAHVEQLAMNLAVRASYTREYGHRERPPFDTTKLVRYLHQISDKQGPLSTYSGLLKLVLARMDQFTGIRATMAHASVQALSRAPVTFRRMKVEGAEVHNLEQRFELDELRRLALKYARFSKACHRLHSKIDAVGLLPPLSYYSSD